MQEFTVRSFDITGVTPCPSGTTYIHLKSGFTVGVDFDESTQTQRVCLYSGNDDLLATMTCGEAWDDGPKAWVEED
jgi:hypothetical protein